MDHNRPDHEFLISQVIAKHQEMSVENRILRSFVSLALAEIVGRSPDPHSHLFRLTETLRVALYDTLPTEETDQKDDWRIMEELVDDIDVMVRSFVTPSRRL